MMVTDETVICEAFLPDGMICHEEFPDELSWQEHFEDTHLDDDDDDGAVTA